VQVATDGRGAARATGLPAGRGAVPPLSTIGGFAAAPSTGVPLDDVDLRLLHLLSEDARLSQRALARELGMSAPAIGERVARLERQGVIRGYGVRVDWSAVGYPTIVHLTVVAAPDAEQATIMSALAALAEVEEIMLVTGDIDMLVRLRVRDHTHLRALLLNQVWQIPGIQRTETSLSIAEYTPANATARMIAALREDDVPIATTGGTRR
jgi:Lrp/AsnC family transcriptional regulator, leucine-responsive regulatory protein